MGFKADLSGSKIILLIPLFNFTVLIENMWDILGKNLMLNIPFINTNKVKIENLVKRDYDKTCEYYYI